MMPIRQTDVVETLEKRGRRINKAVLAINNALTECPYQFSSPIEQNWDGHFD
jgi:hypothetical protein